MTGQTCLAPFYLAYEKSDLRWPVRKGQKIQKKNLRHIAPFALSGVCVRLVEIWGLSSVRSQFPQCGVQRVIEERMGN